MKLTLNHSAEGHSFVLGHGIDPDSRTIYLVGQVDEEMAFRFLVGFRLLDASKGPIRIVLNSGGGSESDGLAIYDALKLAKNDVTIDCYGHAQSIAALILQGAKRRRVAPQCRLMVHNGQLEVGGRIYQGTMVAVGRESEFLTKRYRQILAQVSGQSPKRVAEWCDQEKYFSAEEAVRWGFADEIITPETVELPKLKRRRILPMIPPALLLGGPDVLVDIDPETVEKVLKKPRKPRKE